MESDIAQWALIGVGITLYAFREVRKWYQGKNGKASSNPYPCKEHGEKIDKLRTEVIRLIAKFEAHKESSEKEQEDIKKDIDSLFKKYNGIRSSK